MNLFSISKPRFHVLAGETVEVDQYVAKLRFEGGSRIAVRVLRGQNMETIKAFYDELAAVLQFPLYFGRNWDALDECLADLEWLPAEGYVLIFADSPSILKSADAKDIEGFLSLLSRSSNDWAEGSSLGGGLTRKPTPFHVVFQAGAAEADQFIHRVEAAIAGPVSKITLPETK